MQPNAYVEASGVAGGGGGGGAAGPRCHHFGVTPHYDVKP